MGFAFFFSDSERGSPTGPTPESRDPERRGRCAGWGAEPQDRDGLARGGGGGVRGPPPAPPGRFAARLSPARRVVAALLLGPCIQPGRSSSGARGCAGLRGAWEPTRQGHAPLSDAGQGPVSPPWRLSVWCHCRVLSSVRDIHPCFSREGPTVGFTVELIRNAGFVTLVELSWWPWDEAWWWC